MHILPKQNFLFKNYYRSIFLLTIFLQFIRHPNKFIQRKNRAYLMSRMQTIVQSIEFRLVKLHRVTLTLQEFCIHFVNKFSAEQTNIVFVIIQAINKFEQCRVANKWFVSSLHSSNDPRRIVRTETKPIWCTCLFQTFNRIVNLVLYVFKPENNWTRWSTKASVHSIAIKKIYFSYFPIRKKDMKLNLQFVSSWLPTSNPRNEGKATNWSMHPVPPMNLIKSWKFQVKASKNSQRRAIDVQR